MMDVVTWIWEGTDVIVCAFSPASVETKDSEGTAEMASASSVVKGEWGNNSLDWEGTAEMVGAFSGHIEEGEVAIIFSKTVADWGMLLEAATDPKIGLLKVVTAAARLLLITLKSLLGWTFWREAMSSEASADSNWLRETDWATWAFELEAEDPVVPATLTDWEDVCIREARRPDCEGLHWDISVRGRVDFCWVKGVCTVEPVEDMQRLQNVNK